MLFMVLWKYKDKQFYYGHSVLTVGVFVTQLSSSAAISVWRIVWVMTDCCFLSNIHHVLKD